jgi:hypothetical protein
MEAWSIHTAIIVGAFTFVTAALAAAIGWFVVDLLGLRPIRLTDKDFEEMAAEERQEVTKITRVTFTPLPLEESLATARKATEPLNSCYWCGEQSARYGDMCWDCTRTRRNPTEHFARNRFGPATEKMRREMRRKSYAR